MPRRRTLIRWCTAIAVVLSLLLGWELYSSIRELRDLESERASVQAELDDINASNQSLEEDIAEAGTDDYVIRMARKLLGWVFPEDIRIVDEETKP